MKKEITKEEYGQACERLEELIDVITDDTPEDDPRSKEMDRICYIIEAYEKIHYPMH